MNDNATIGTGLGHYRRMRILTGFLCLLVPLMLIGLFAHAARQAGNPSSAAVWLRQLDLSSPALWPSGTAARHPQHMTDSVDLRPGYCIPLTTDRSLPDKALPGMGEKIAP